MSRARAAGIRRPWLLPLTPLYALANSLCRRHFARHPELIHHLHRPVVSIGSLSSGGAGKTPFLMTLARLLTGRGLSIDVLSRGYGRRGTAVTRVDPNGSADSFGDEPLLIARSTGCPVYVGAQRIHAGRLAEKDSPSSLHLLDDGFQHRRLARAIDIVLVTEQDLRDRLLPAGDLREGLSALTRAQILVLRADEAAGVRASLAHRFRILPRIWIIERTLALPEAPTQPMVFCGIARPYSLLQMLSRQGVAPIATAFFRDHHAYRERDIIRLLEKAKAAGAQSLITTGKDAVKLTRTMREILAPVGPLITAELRTDLRNPEACLNDLELLLATPVRSSP